MGKAQFKDIIAEFSPRFQYLGGLAEKLHQALFPISEGKLFTGTDMSPEGTNKLYQEMINAFNAAL